MQPPSRQAFSLELPNLQATATLGRHLGSLLFGGAVIALMGELGSGKTQLARAIAEGLGVGDGRIVTSPTFVLVQEYEGRLPIYHFDAYRLHSQAEFAELGAQEYFQSGGVCLVEWADRVADCLPAEHLVIRLQISGPNTRTAVLSVMGSRYERLLQELIEQLS
jgi:tRNA threonylcarbamoyladenosine biosynthesis protein TsaE